MRRSIIECDDPRRRIERWTAATRYTGLGLNHHGLRWRANRFQHVFCMWTPSGCGASQAPRVGTARERFGTSLEHLCIACMRVGRVYHAFVCVALCTRDARGCAPSRNVVEPAGNAHILRCIPGAVPRNFMDAGRALRRISFS